MIDIQHKEDCVGCNACTQRCPKSCISMQEDEEGFLYPQVDVSRCINCGLCERVCPVLNQPNPQEPINTYAATNTNTEEKFKSSSGGIFILLAKKVIEEGGVVFGAKFNEQWEVVHGYAETIEDAKAFQSSKYVQSRIGTAFKDAETFLNAGRNVMFTGTPCQLRGLGLFLRKDYGNQLLKVDVVCHGVPSPLVWRKYLTYITRTQGNIRNNDSSTIEECSIASISFRDKRISWEKFGFSIKYRVKSNENKDMISHPNLNIDFFQPHSENLYMRIFLRDLDLRPSCYKCPAKQGKAISDVTIADFWGIEKEYSKLYDKGMYSLVLVNSKVGNNALDSIDIDKSTVQYSLALKGNKAIEQSANKPRYYSLFWTIFNSKGIEASSKVLNKFNPSLLRRIVRKGRKIISKLF